MFLHFWYLKYKDTPGVSNLVGTGASKVHSRHPNSKYTYMKYKNAPGVSKLGGTGASIHICAIQIANKCFAVFKVQNRSFAVSKVQKRLCCIKPGRYRCIKNTFVVSNPIPELPALLHSLLQILHN